MNTIYISSQKKSFKQIIQSIFKNIDNSLVVNELPHNFTMHKLKGRTEVKLDLGDIPLKNLNIENTMCSVNVYHKAGFPITQIPLNEIGEVENLEYRIHNNQLLLSLVHKQKSKNWFQRKREQLKNVVHTVRTVRGMMRQV